MIEKIFKNSMIPIQIKNLSNNYDIPQFHFTAALPKIYNHH